jgi:ATP-dependent helicase/nuclease subunit B
MEPGAAVAKELGGKSGAAPGWAFATCPYRHFVRYTLGLKPRREFKLDPLDLGLFYHSVLDSLQRRLSAERESFASVKEDRLVPLLDEQIAKLMEQDSFLSNFVQRSAHNAFVIYSAGEVLRDCVLAIAQMVRAGSFRPRLSEAAFGHAADASSKFSRFELPLPDGRRLILSGKIDRLDVAEVNGRKAALILDYKRTQSGARFDWSSLYHGLDSSPSTCCGAPRRSAYADEMPERLPIETPLRGPGRRSSTRGSVLRRPDHQRREWAPRRRRPGYSDYYGFYVKKDGDPYGQYSRSSALRPAHFTRLLESARKNIIRLAVDIASGRIECRPYHRGSERGCMFCDFLPVCHFDWQINDYNFLQPMNKDSLFEQLENG